MRLNETAISAPMFRQALRMFCEAVSAGAAADQVQTGGAQILAYCEKRARGRPAAGKVYPLVRPVLQMLCSLGLASLMIAPAQLVDHHDKGLDGSIVDLVVFDGPENGQ
jgi:hypothetical protein